jgi:hypothetical protein
VLPQDAGQAAAGDHADLGADELDRPHHREGEQRGPERRESERRSSLRIRADARRIVVRRASDEAGSELRQEPAPCGEYSG